MRIEKIGKHIIEFYNSTDELTSDRFALWNKMLLIDSGLGSDFDSIDSHINKAIQFIKKDRKENAIQELINMRSSFYFVLEDLNPKHLSYAVMIHKIDGKLMTDLSEENLRRIIDQLAEWGAKRSFLDEITDSIKKKFNRN